MTLLEMYLDRQLAFNTKTFGPPRGGVTVAGVLDHIRKELKEIEAANGLDVEEWIDVVILAFDGALRGAGATPDQVAQALEAKLAKNMAREWPDWRTAEPGKAIEHKR